MFAASRLNRGVAEAGLSIHAMYAEPQSLLFLIFITMIFYLVQISRRIGGLENNCYRMVELERRTGILKRRTVGSVLHKASEKQPNELIIVVYLKH
jgi:hypothetical protein